VRHDIVITQELESFYEGALMEDTGAGRGRPLVLVVDDDADLRSLAQMQLGDGFDVIQAADGPRCVTLARQERPDVILLDMMMPGMDGAEVLERLSASPRTKDIPVIFLSALAGMDDRVRGLESGAVDYIAKPVEQRELVARVGVAARTSARHKMLESRVVSDQQTGLPGRNEFDERLNQEVSRSDRSSAALSIMLIDIDRMSEINEKLGEELADELLEDVAALLRGVFRRADGVYRYGGDEFSAILPDTDIATSYLAAERCRQAVSTVTCEGKPVSISIGMAEFSTGRKPEELVAKAEIALFRAKESGGNRSWRADDPRKRSINPIALSEELTEREWDVLAHLANHRTEQDIARRMGIRPGTVRSHKARIRRKLDVDPEMRLAEFARSNFRELVNRLERLSLDEDQVVT
jgi:diguanylate cyclase (GGDEF)-like protein